MGKRIVFLLWFMGILPFLIASSLSAQTDYPACSTFGVQRFQEKKVAHAFSLKMARWETGEPQRLQGEARPVYLLGLLVLDPVEKR